MSKVRRIDWSPDEWIGGTWSYLSLAETAVYIATINQIYSRGGLVANDASFIAKAFSDGHWRSVRTALDSLVAKQKLQVSPDGKWLSNGRANRELNRATERIQSAAKAAQEAGKNHSRRAQERRDPAKNNGLTEPRGSYHQLPYDYDLNHKKSTEAAREPSPELAAAQARAPTRPAPKTAERVAALAAMARAKLLKSGA